MRATLLSPFSFASAFALVALALQPSVAAAQAVPAASEAAERAFTEGLSLMDAGRYVEACAKLETSEALAPASGTLLNLADCYEHLGRIGSAWQLFERAAERALASGKTERERVARARAALLAPRLSRISLYSSGHVPAGLTVELSGRELPASQWGKPLVVDPGTHSLLLRAPGRKTLSTTLGPIAEGGTAAFALPALQLAEPAPDAREPGLDAQQVGAVLGAAASVVFVATGTAFGLQSLAKHEESDRYCSGNACTEPRGPAAMDEARVAGNRATASFVVAGVALSTAAVLWFVRPFSSPRSAQVGVGPGALLVRGAF
jgi:hypothetical protein